MFNLGDNFVVQLVRNLVLIKHIAKNWINRVYHFFSKTRRDRRDRMVVGFAAPVASTNKSDHEDVTEILSKVTLKTITLIPNLTPLLQCIQLKMWNFYWLILSGYIKHPHNSMRYVVLFYFDAQICDCIQSCNWSYTTVSTSGAGTTYPYLNSPMVFSGVRFTRSLVLCVMYCILLFVLFLLAIVLFVLLQC